MVENNMRITERQEKILNKLIEDYVLSAQPISSEFLERKHRFGLSPATLRIEMQKLTDGGYLAQPHTSSGRVPTDKGYRFFVDKILKEKKQEVDMESWMEDEFEDTIKFFQSLTRKLALESQSLVFSYLKDEDIFWKEGWEEILKEPEFGDQDYLVNFAEFLEDFEKDIEEFKMSPGIKIYIGRENPFNGAKDFSMIFSRCRLPNSKDGILSLVGPKRMDYGKNINLINSLTEALAEIKE